MAVDPLRPDQLETRSGEQERDGSGDRRDEGGQDPPVRFPEPVREMPDRKEPVVPRGDRAAEQADPQGRVLDEGARTGDPRSQGAAPDDLENRKDRHAGEEADRDGVLDAGRDRRRGAVPRPTTSFALVGYPQKDHRGHVRKFGGGDNGYLPALFPPRWAARYSSRYDFTVSNASAGMIFPRIRE